MTNLSLSFNQLLPSGILELRNALKTIQMDFGVRSDQIVTDAKLHLIYPVTGHVTDHVAD